jgi:hypothetical protein
MAEKLEPAEVFHEVLEHRWFLSQAAGHEVSMEKATRSYLDTVLRHRPDEKAFLDSSLMGIGSLEDDDDDELDDDQLDDEPSDDDPDAFTDDAALAATPQAQVPSPPG